MKSILVIIDMQSDFVAAQSESVQLAVIKEIEQARKQNQKIIVLSYYRHGPTLHNILQSLRGYKHTIYRRKHEDDGSKLIVRCVGRRYKGYFRICGVNTGGCVLKTVRSMSEIFGKSHVKVIANACASQKGQSTHDSALRKMSCLDNVSVII